MLQMIFELNDGQLVSRRPRNPDQSARIPDGEKWLSLAQAAEQTGHSVDDLKRTWLEDWEKNTPPADLAQAIASADGIPPPPPGPAPLKIDALDQLRRNRYPDLSVEEFNYMLEFAVQRGLDVWANHLYPEPRHDATLNRRMVDFRPTIDGLRFVAHASGCYAGKDKTEIVTDDKGAVVEATATVYRICKGKKRRFAATVDWSEYAPLNIEGTLWKTKPRTMMRKCAEAAALRAAFPEKLGGLYINEEMAQPGPKRPGKPSPEQVAVYGVQPDDNTPGSRFQLELKLMDLGFKTPESRQKLIRQFAELFPDLYAQEDDPRRFNATLLFYVCSDPATYGATA